MKKIKVVQIGIGHDHAALILNSLLRQSDIFEVEALGLPETEKTDFADKVENYRNLIPIMSAEEALNIENIDAAVIETEESNLTKYALLAAQKGLSVHMDKPGGLELDAFKALIDIFRENKSVFHLGYMYRYNHAINEAIKKAKSGEIGEVYCVEAHMDCQHTPEKRQWLARFPGGMTFYLGCHLIDLILRIMGDPEKIIPMNQSTGIDGVTGEDYGFVVFKYKNGISFAKTCAAEPGGFERRQLVICGSKGTIELYPLEDYDSNWNVFTGVRYTPAEKGKEWSYSAPVINSAAADRYDGMMSSFARMVCEEAENPYTLDYELKLYKTLLRSCGIKQ